MRRLYLIRRATPRVFIGRQKLTKKKHLGYLRGGGETKRELSTRGIDRLAIFRKTNIQRDSDIGTNSLNNPR